jgi:hypothetical protein
MMQTKHCDVLIVGLLFSWCTTSLGNGIDIALLAPVSGKNGCVGHVELEIERCLDNGKSESRGDSLSLSTTSGKLRCG